MLDSFPTGSSEPRPASAVCAALVALLGTVAAGSWAAELPEFCDPGIEVNAENESAYRHYPEEGHCEGRYVDQVSGSSLSVGSLTAPGSKLPEDASGSVDFDWPADGGTLRLRAVSLRPNTFYRMDAEADQHFHWSTVRMVEDGLSPAEIGVVAVRRGAGRAVHVPVRVTAEGASARHESTRLVIVPHQSVEKIYLAVTRLDDDGQDVEAVRASEELGHRFYAANRPVSVALPELDEPGAHFRVEIGAITSAGHTDTRDVLIYVPDE